MEERAAAASRTGRQPGQPVAAGPGGGRLARRHERHIRAGQRTSSGPPPAAFPPLHPTPLRRAAAVGRWELVEGGKLGEAWGGERRG